MEQTNCLSHIHGKHIDKNFNKMISSWEIEIPPYESKEELRQKLLLAIFEGQESFMMN